MTGKPLLSRCRSFLLISSFTSILTICTVGPTWGQEQQPAKTEPTSADLQARVDALRARVDALEHAATPAPWGAWLAVGIVGGLFALAWTLVSVQRERSRRHDAITTAIVTLAEKASPSTADEQVKELVKELRTLVSAAQSLSAFERLLRLFKV